MTGVAIADDGHNNCPLSCCCREPAFGQRVIEGQCPRCLGRLLPYDPAPGFTVDPWHGWDSRGWAYCHACDYYWRAVSGHDGSGPWAVQAPAVCVAREGFPVVSLQLGAEGTEQQG